ncbi:L-xylo-3-hexulose reductase [Didymella sp. IMI 355093]|nr:L-xylo-3-hexulose reductase [Didymella sp. IMI 355093]
MSTGRPYAKKLGIVTGGSRGIGAAVARRLAAKGCNLVIGYGSPRSTDMTRALCDELAAAHNVCCAPVQAELLEPQTAADSILDAARSLFKSYNASGPFQIDIVINNAGVSSNQHLNDTEQGPIQRSEFDRVYTVNVLAPLLLTQVVQPYLPKDRSGRIVNVSSVSSSIGYQGQSVYAGTKAAIEAMTRVWSRELSENAIVNCVNPGPAWGDMYERAGPTFWNINQPYVDVAPLANYSTDGHSVDLDTEEKDRFDKVVSEGMGGRRPGLTDEIAGTVDMLCSAEAGWTTGSVVCANGGMRMSFA